MLSRRLLTISLLLTAISGYLVFFTDVTAVGYYIMLGADICGAMMAYVFQHQLNWWWHRKFPPVFPGEIEQLYLRSAPFYIALSPELRREFEIRVALFIESKEFIAQGFNEVAEEIKYLIAYYAVTVSFKRGKYTFSPYDRIVIYLHPFLSPNVPDTVHAYEIEHTDGTIIFSLEQLTAGFLHPEKYYQVGYHAFAELYAGVVGPLDDSTADAIWGAVSQCTGWSKSDIENFTGLEQKSPVATAIHCWFSHNSALQSHSPVTYDEIRGWLARHTAV
jgi:hypothetical protein